MTLKEFAQRTGFEPTYKYFFEVIHEEYMQSELAKDAFCRQWKRKGGIQKAYDAMCMERNEQQDLVKRYKRIYDSNAVSMPFSGIDHIQRNHEGTSGLC